MCCRFTVEINNIGGALGRMQARTGTSEVGSEDDLLKYIRPFPRCVHNGQNPDFPTRNLIGQDIGKSWDDKFPCPFYAAGASDVGVFGKNLCGPP